MNLTAENRQLIRTYVRSAYQQQQLRIQMGNRIVANFKVKLGQQPSKSEDEIDEEGKEILDNLRKDYKKITDGLKTFPTQAKFKAEGLLTSYTETCLLSQYIEMEKGEERQFNRLGQVLLDYPIYTEFLEKIKGIGPAMAGVIISEFDIYKAKYSSSLEMYIGLDVVKDDAGNGYGRSNRGEHLVKRAYKDKDGNDKERNSVTFNPWLRTKLLGVLSGSFLRAGNEKYVQVYKDAKHRYENHEKYGTHNDNKPDVERNAKYGYKFTITNKTRRHRMAIRKMIKAFLIDLYVAWKTIEGLEVHRPYAEAKLGMKHGEGQVPKAQP